MRHYWHPSRFHIDHLRFSITSNFPTQMRIFPTHRTLDRARSESEHKTDRMTLLPPLFLSDGPVGPYYGASTVSDPSVGFQSDLAMDSFLVVAHYFHTRITVLSLIVSHPTILHSHATAHFPLIPDNTSLHIHTSVIRHMHSWNLFINRFIMRSFTLPVLLQSLAGW